MASESTVVEPHDDPSGEPGGRAGGGAVAPWASSPLRRVSDPLVGLLLTIVTLPVVLVLAIGSAIAFRAWPIFRQPRVGRDGRPFAFVKIRSLPRTTPGDIDKYLLQDHLSSKWGRFIRRTHLDEFPQCWLLVTGKMSLVGPRPEMPSLSNTYDPAFVAARLQVRPGLTGPWQISPDSAGLIGESPQYDLWYLAHASPTLDLWLVWRTVLGLFGGAPLTLEQYPRRFVDPR